MGEFVDFVYLYFLFNGRLVERHGELYTNNLTTTEQKLFGFVRITKGNSEYWYPVYLQPGRLYDSDYVWYYKQNRRAAAKVFGEQLVSDIRRQQAKVNAMWEVYGTLEHYIKKEDK